MGIINFIGANAISLGIVYVVIVFGYVVVYKPRLGALSFFIITEVAMLLFLAWLNNDRDQTIASFDKNGTLMCIEKDDVVVNISKSNGFEYIDGGFMGKGFVNRDIGEFYHVGNCSVTSQK